MRDWLQLQFCGAGGSAQERFGELASRWRRRKLKGLRLFTAVAMPALVVGALFERHYGAWALGLATGSVWGLFISMRDEVPAYIEAWRSGYTGERKTAKVLVPFRRDGCIVLHDLPDRRTEVHTKGNVDHVLVAPWGVFVLDSKMWGGSVSVDGDAVHMHRLDDDDDADAALYDHVAGAMRGEAARLKEDIEAASGIRLWVTAVVVFWCPFEMGDTTVNNVTYVHGDQLATWLENYRRDKARTAPMTADNLARIVAAIDCSRPREARPWWRELQLRTGLRQDGGPQSRPASAAAERQSS